MHHIARPFTSLRSLSQRTMSVKYITNDELAELMKSGRKPGKDYLVVDVRDADFVGGNIKDAKNIPSKEFLGSVDELVKDVKDVPLVVFHCTLSQVRGPKAARIYDEARLNVLGEDNGQDVYVLRNGFSDFQAKFKDDPDLVEEWDKDVWNVES